MAISAEKNDVNIEKLFHWGTKCEITDKYGKFIVDAYIRLVGDAEMSIARTKGIRKSSELRKRLKDENSDEFVVFIQTALENLEKEGIVELVSMYKIKELSIQSAKEVHIPLPKEPKSDASLEEQEEYQKKVDEYDVLRSQTIIEMTTKKLEKEQKYLDTLSIEDLHKLFIVYVTNDMCEKEMITKYKEHCVYFGIYADPEYKTRMFNSFEDFENLPPEIKDQFIEAYDGLEINIDDLKKLLVATP